MVSADKVQLMAISGVSLFTILISIVCTDSSRLMAGVLVEKWILSGCVLMYSLFSLTGVLTANPADAIVAIVMFMTGIAFYYTRHVGHILTSWPLTVASFITLIVLLVLVAPLAGFLMQVRVRYTGLGDRLVGDEDKSKDKQKVPFPGSAYRKSVAARFTKKTD